MHYTPATPLWSFPLYNLISAVLHAIAIFLSSFLLFQVQPIIAKMIRPWFGGAASAWSTCRRFFQVVLLAG